ncbi:hypothetical protein M433DRAFT_176420 [Acidomyces richmondensis BFW]|nr:MAG: hypothetical protein FE78DRAFT_27366 [Acidomyces sp. 'richmondensis']KYG42845.1 hypothetical protein M433DRAFT_176420 [Acidomyces richmondensis BFW]
MSLEDYDPTKAEKYDPGTVVIFFDNRHSGGPANGPQLSTYQSYRLWGLQKLGWPSFDTPDLEPGKIRLVWYTHAGNEGQRDYPLYMAYTVKEMFDSLSDEGFRPMIVGYSAENPYPMIGGAEPPAPPKKPTMPKPSTSASGRVSGHSGAIGGTPHDRVMAIIEKEEAREAKKRAEEVYIAEKAGNLAV